MHEGVAKLTSDRYLWNWNIEGKEYKETLEMMFLRVAKKIASAWLQVKKADYKGVAERANTYFNLMNKGLFMSSSPQLFNAMRGYGEDKAAYDLIYKPINEMLPEEWDILNNFKNSKAAYGSCYAVGQIGDSIEEIYDSLKEQAMIFKAAGGYGASFSALRSKGEYINTTKGQSCGAVEFMELFNLNTKKIALSGQLKRGANMFSLSVSHPDIEEFIDKKMELINDEDTKMIRSKYLEHANLSVEVSNDFIHAVKEDLDWELIDPHSKKVKKILKARDLYRHIIKNAMKSGEPGILMKDNINRFNPIKDIEPITSVNPCVTGDTLVPTTKGLIRADELKEGMLTWNPVKHKMEKITKVFNNGIKDIYEITLTNGMKLKATPEHKLKTKSGKLVEIQNLSIQDTLEISLEDTLKFVKQTKLPVFEQDEKSLSNNSLSTFKYINDLDMAWLIGTMVGDGTIYANCNKSQYTTTFTIGNTKKSIHTNIERILKDMKVTYKIIETPTSTIQFVVNGKNFTRYIAFLMEIKKDSNNEIHTKNNKKIPSWLYKSSKDIVLSFIAGLLDSDGTVNITKKGSNIAIVSIYEQLLYDLQQLLISTGIRSSISVMREKRNMKDPRNGQTYKSNKAWRLTISTVNKKALSELEKFMCCMHKKYNMLICINMNGPNSNYYASESKFVKIKSIKKLGKEVVYDVAVPDDYMWVTNGFISLDCSEYLGYDNTVCNLGSINLYSLVDFTTKSIMESLFEEVVMTAVEYLNLALLANEYPTEELTRRSLEFRPIGLGFMGLGSTFVALGYKYGDEDSLKFTRDFMDLFMYNVVKGSNKFFKDSKVLFKYYEHSDYAKGDFAFINIKFKKEISKMLKEGITNSRLAAIAPNGSIPFIVAGAMGTKASSISGGVEPLFDLAFTRRVNPDTDEEYKINEIDIGVYDTLKSMGYSDEDIAKLLDSPEDMKKVFKAPQWTTAKDLTVEEHLNILKIVTDSIDMQASKTVNLPNTYTEDMLYDFYIKAHDMGLKGLTVYVDGSRSGILESKKKTPSSEFIVDLNFTKQGKILPKERPVIIQSLKKTLKFSEDGKTTTSIVNIEVGFDNENNPFEVFIRSTTSTKEYTELFNAIGRLVSLALRSNADVEAIIKQIRKIKGWDNKYSDVARLIASTISELAEIGKLKSKKKRDDTIKEINKHNLVTTPKGYLVDPATGDAYCPACYAKKGERLNFSGGCITCTNCGWSGCE